MKNINKNKTPNLNVSQHFKFPSQNDLFKSKSNSLKRQKRQSTKPIHNKKLKLRNSHLPQNVLSLKSQSIQKINKKTNFKKDYRLTEPNLCKTLISASLQKLSQKNSKSKVTFKNLKKQQQDLKKENNHKTKQCFQVFEKVQKNTGAKQNKKLPKSKSKTKTKTQKIKSLLKIKSNSKTNKKLIKYDNCLFMNIVKKDNSQKVVKSSCITRNVSKNNSKQKDYNNTKKQLNEKFKKKQFLKGGLQKKTKISHVYSSVKISPRNSFKFVQTNQNQFFILDLNDSIQKGLKGDFKKCKKDSNVEIKKIKSEKNIYERLKQFADFKNHPSFIAKNDIKQPFKKKQKFSFLQFKQKDQPISNPYEVSIEKLLEASTDQLFLDFECTQNRQKKVFNAENQRFLLAFKQQQFSNFQKLQELSIYESQLHNQRSYSTSSELFKIAQKNQVNFKEIYSNTKCFNFFERVQILDWLSALSSQLLLKTQTFHFAVAYYDIYVSMISEHFTQENQKCLQKSINQLKLIGLGCILIAIKMDQREYQFDILNAIMSLQANFSRKDIIRAEFQILKKLRLKLKLETLSFWLDYFSLRWDQYLLSGSDFLQQTDKVLLRFVDGTSYENYRKVISILNAILLDGGIFQYDLIQIVLSVIYSVFYEIICKENKLKVLQEIKCTNNNVNFEIIDEKQVLKSYATRDTLNQLSQSNMKQNTPQNHALKNNLNLLTQNQVKTKTNFQLSQKKHFSEDSLSFFTRIFNQFLQKICRVSFQNLENSIKYVQSFLPLKMDFEMDQRVYEEARNYEEFIRFHSHLPFSKTFVIEIHNGGKRNFTKNYQRSDSSIQSQFDFNQNIFNTKYDSDPIHNSRISSSNISHEKINNTLEKLLFEKQEKIFQHQPQI